MTKNNSNSTVLVPHGNVTVFGQSDSLSLVLHGCWIFRVNFSSDSDFDSRFHFK